MRLTLVDSSMAMRSKKASSFRRSCMSRDELP